MSTSLTIPDNINELSPLKQVFLFQSHGLTVFPLHPPGNGKEVNTPLEKKIKRLHDRDVYRHFGNGAHYNIGVIPKEGELIINLDGVNNDRGYVDRFLSDHPALTDIPRVQTPRGYHLWFQSDDLPTSIRKDGYLLQIEIAPGVNCELFTTNEEHYVAAPPSIRDKGFQHTWVKTGEVPQWSWQQIVAAFNLDEDQEGAPQDDTHEQQQVADNDGRLPDRPRWLDIPLPGADREELDLVWMGMSHYLASKVFKNLAETNRYFIREGNLVCYDPTSTSGARLVEISADELRSRLDKRFRVRRPTRIDQPQRLFPATATADDARLLLGSQEMREQLKEVGRVMKHPLLVVENGEPKILTTGAHDGLFIDSDDVIPVVSVSEAVASILGLLEDFKFRTESDRSRAVSHFLSPALVFGSLLSGRVPFHVVEADKPGSGKGFLQKLITTIYNEAPGVVINIKKGIGSTDGTLSRRLLDGCAFIQYDNYRGRLDSEMQESALTEDKAPCRALHTEGEVSTKGAFFMMTSNGAELTEDLSDRSCFVRIIKQDEAYEWIWEGDELLVHVKDKWGYYLGCIYSILSEWIRQGKPSTTAVNLHRFRSWAGSMDWIVKNLFHLAPMLDGHKEVQKAVASPMLVFLRQAAIHLKKEGRIGEELKALDLIQLAQNHGLSIQGIKDLSDEKAHQVLGSKLSPLFKGSNTLKLDESFTVIRKEENVKRDNGGFYDRKHYVFFETTPPHTTPPSTPDSGDPKSDPVSPKSGPVESTPGPTAHGLAKNDHTTSGFTPGPHHPMDREWCGGLVPQHHGLAEYHHTTTPHNTILDQYNASVDESEKNCVGGENNGDPWCGGAKADDILSLVVPVVSAASGDMSFYLIRKKSEITHIADTLAGIQEPLAIELKTYDRHSSGPQGWHDTDIRLLSIKAPNSPAWVIDLKETGYELVELKNVLQNHELIMESGRTNLLRLSFEFRPERVWCTNIARDVLDYVRETAGFRIPFELARFLADEPRDPGACTQKIDGKITTSSGTDWREPLTDAQYAYAAAGVEYLYTLKTLLAPALAESQSLPTFQYQNSKVLDTRPAKTSFLARPDPQLKEQTS